MESARLQALAVRIDQEIEAWLRKTGVDEVKPKDVMPHLIEKGLFSSDNKEGQPLRKVLRELDHAGLLSIMSTVHVEQKKTNRYWYFRLPSPR